MLRHTFCHVPGIGEKTERGLWSSGVISWEAAIGQLSIRLPRSIAGPLDCYLEESLRNYERRNGSYFAKNLESKHHWRLYRDFQDCCAFLDIETTGLFATDEITTIVLYDGRWFRSYVNGLNLDQFPRDVQDYSLLVTYNGKQFDIPKIEAYFGIKLSQAHIDLRYPLSSLGLSGGLKGCERQLGIARPGLEEVDGLLAVHLWNDYRQRKNIKEPLHNSPVLYGTF